VRRVAGKKSLEEVERKIEDVIEEVGIYGDFMTKVEEILYQFLKEILEDGEEREVELEICTNNCGQICCTKYYYTVGKTYLEFEDMEREPCWTRASPSDDEYDYWNWCGVYSVSLRLF